MTLVTLGRIVLAMRGSRMPRHRFEESLAAGDVRGRDARAS